MSFRAVETVLEHSQARGSDRLILVVIAECANHEGEQAWPSVETIARRAGVSRATVHRSFKRLETIGELEVDYKAGAHGCNRYRVSLIQQLELSQSETVAKRDSVNGATETVAPVRPEPSKPPPLSSKDERGSVESDREKAERIFAVWTEEFGKGPRTKLNAARLSKIKARFREDYTAADLIAAVRGAKRDDWIMGRDSRSPGYTDLVTILRDGAQVEKLRELYRPEKNGRRRPSLEERTKQLVAKGVEPDMAAEQAKYEASRS